MKRIFLTIAAITAFAGNALAQVTPPKLSDFLTGSGLQIKGGYRYNFDAKESKFNLSVSFKDTNLYSTGTPFGNTNIPIGDDPIAFGDAPLKFTFGPGGSEIGGTLLTGFSATPLKLGGIGGKDFRLILGADAQIEKQSQSISFAGFEWVPFGIYDASKETFVGISGRFDRQSEANADAKEFVSANIRGRIGFGSQFSLTSQRKEQIRDDLTKITSLPDDAVPAFFSTLAEKRGVQFYDIAPLIEVTFQDIPEDVRSSPGYAALSPADKAKIDLLLKGIDGIGEVNSIIDADGSNLRIKAQARLIQALGALPPTEENKPILTIAGRAWKAGVIKVLEIQSSSIASLGKDSILRKLIDNSAPNQPRVSYFAEFDGSVADKSVYGGKSARGILSLNVRVLQDAKNADSPFVWLRYEVGRTLAEPDKNIANLSLTFGVKF